MIWISQMEHYREQLIFNGGIVQICICQSSANIVNNKKYLIRDSNAPIG